jgi:hypothetical protein
MCTRTWGKTILPKDKHWDRNPQYKPSIWLTFNIAPHFRVVSSMMRSMWFAMDGEYKVVSKLTILPNQPVRVPAQTHKHICMHACMYGCMHACMSVRMYVCLYVCLYVCMSVWLSVCECMHACVHIETYTHHMHICTHTYLYCIHRCISIHMHIHLSTNM